MMRRWFPLDEHEALLALGLIPGVGSRIGLRLLQHFGNAADVFQATPKRLCELEGIGQQTAQRICQGPDANKLSHILQRIQRHQIWTVSYADPDYPQSLLQLRSPPFLLFGRGERRHLSHPQRIAVVGTRKPDRHGIQLTQEAVVSLCGERYAIVSGGARGIDACVHHSTLQQGGQTWVIMGSGVDIAYPSEHRHLFSQIIAQQGLLLSEFMPGTKPERGFFPRRNRLIAALSQAVVVIQCSQKSGALNTAEVAQRLHLPVLTYPGRPQEPLAGGPHQLLRKGAWLVERGQEIHQRLSLTTQDHTQLALWETLPTAPSPPTTIQPKIDIPAPLQRLWQTLQTTPAHVDEVAVQLQTDIQSVTAQLVELELLGCVQALPGMRYARRP